MIRNQDQHGSESERLLDVRPEKPTATGGQTLDIASYALSAETSARKRGNQEKMKLENSAPLPLDAIKHPSTTSPPKTQKTTGSTSNNRLSHESQFQLQRLKTKLIERKETAEQVKKIVFNSKAHQFYQ